MPRLTYEQCRDGGLVVLGGGTFLAAEAWWGFLDALLAVAFVLVVVAFGFVIGFREGTGA